MADLYFRHMGAPDEGASGLTGGKGGWSPAVRRILGGATFRAIGGIGGAAALSQLAALVAAPLLARLYPSEAFGQFGSLTAYCNIVSTFLLLGLSDAILAAHDETTVRELLGGALRISAALLVPATVLSAVAIENSWFGLGALPLSAVILIVPLMAFLVLASLFQASLVNLRRFRPLGMSYLAMGWSRALTQIAGGLAGAAFGGLALGEVTGRFIANVTMSRGLRESLSDSWRMPYARWRTAVIAYRRFPLNRTPSSLLSALAVGSPILMVNSLFGPSAAGQFSLMFTMVMGPVAIVQRAIGDVFTGQFGQVYRRERRAGQRYAAAFAVTLGMAGLAGAVVLQLAAPRLFAFVFGPQWLQAGRMAAASAPWLAVLLPAVPLSQILIITHRPELKLAFDFTYVLTLAGLFLLALDGRFDALGFVVVLSWASAAVYALFFPLIAIALRRPGSVVSRNP